MKNICVLWILFPSCHYFKVLVLIFSRGCFTFSFIVHPEMDFTVLLPDLREEQ